MHPHVVSIRRYPVKSMGGETLEQVEIDRRGLVGDRWFAVEDADGHFASGKNSRRFRRRDAAFDHTAASVADGVLVSNGSQRWLAGDSALDAELSRVMDAPVRVRAEEGTSHYDSSAVSLIGTASLEWCAQNWGTNADPRRLRVNLVVETDEPFVEDTWAGRTISIGTAQLKVTERVVRCRTIDIDQDGAVGGDRWLKQLSAERDMCLAMYADVAAPGLVRVGGEVHFVDPARVAGLLR